ncbi:hypothetical protein H5P28_05900 [Ruficoccus amylovorans]|uniref:Uncharacterized protein n=1 Tax=Ruficoccus amylovorans TaxID=1804625 RepID=A0A842HC05_9BACT|nr:hypothetical protein [Ruficoccus amylovorans]MBC2593790.1 hypothetical protein [Ruficoccus amylovorans]
MIETIQEGDLTFNRASAPENGSTVWRCIHDGQRVLSAFETDGQTDSVHEIVDFDTKEALETGIAALGLDNPVDEYDPEQAANNEREQRHHQRGN